jgi:hypothetical protein
MTNRWKVGGVAYVFGIQLRDRILTEQSQILLFHTAVHFQSGFTIFLTNLVAMG